VLPNLIIIGAQKCGTTSLHYYLDSHPEISMSKQKELNFFIKDLGWENGLSWYESRFSGKTKIYGESSPGYTYYPLCKGVAERMYSIIPQAKLIYVVRDPLERIVSQYIDRVKDGKITKPLNEELLSEGNDIYIKTSSYYYQLNEFLKFYPPKSILVLLSDDLLNKREETLKKVFQFLNVNDSFQCREFDNCKNVSDGKPSPNN